MAHFAHLREAGLNVIGVLRVLKVCEVASYALPAIELIVAVHVALRALQSDMRAGKRKPGFGMIEFCARPRCGGMA